MLYPHNDEPILLGQCPVETDIVAWIYKNRHEAWKDNELSFGFDVFIFAY